MGAPAIVARMGGPFAGRAGDRRVGDGKNEENWAQSLDSPWV
jgi:hypothetical protein